MTVPELVKKGWFFTPYWSATLELWYVQAAKRTWGVTKQFKHADWDTAHKLAADWAEQEERVINGPDERRDTVPAPAMEAAE